MNYTVTRDENIIANLDIAPQQCAIGQDHVIAELAIMSHVRCGHKEIVIAQSGF